MIHGERNPCWGSLLEVVWVAITGLGRWQLFADCKGPDTVNSPSVSHSGHKACQVVDKALPVFLHCPALYIPFWAFILHSTACSLQDWIWTYCWYFTSEHNNLMELWICPLSLDCPFLGHWTTYLQPPFHNHFSCKWHGIENAHICGSAISKWDSRKTCQVQHGKHISFGFIHSHNPGVNSCSHLYEWLNLYSRHWH